MHTDRPDPSLDDEAPARRGADAAEPAPITIFSGDAIRDLRDAKRQRFAPPLDGMPAVPAAPPPRDPLVDQVVDGQYRLVRRIGAGGHGVVYEAQDELLSRRVAVKVLLRDRAEDPEAVKGFQREARTLALLDHPNVTHLHTTGMDADVHYLVMEYVEGRTVQDILETSGALPVATAVDYTVQACAGLASAHERRIIHRDVKPGNLLVTPGGVVKLTDFGLAKIYEPDATLSSVIGTPHFMPPEQFSGESRDGRTDIYALGVTLYVMLSLEQPHAGDGPAEVLMAKMTRRPTPLSEYRDGLPKGLWPIVARMIHRSRDKRYEHCRDIARDLLALRIRCPWCKAKAPIGNRFCGDCGETIRPDPS